MDTPERSLAKCVTWQATGFAMMVAITYAVTGSLVSGGSIALAGTLAGSITYVVHERVWARIHWGRAPDF